MLNYIYSWFQDFIIKVVPLFLLISILDVQYLCLMFLCYTPRKVQHTPRAHPRQSPYPTMKRIPLWPVGKGCSGCVPVRCVETNNLRYTDLFKLQSSMLALHCLHLNPSDFGGRSSAMIPQWRAWHLNNKRCVSVQGNWPGWNVTSIC